MAFGIDDAMAAVAEGVKLTNTVVEIVKRYKKEAIDLDLDQLIREVRITAIKRIDEADLALTQFERMLTEKKIDIDKRLSDVIAATPFWQPFEQHRLSQIQKQFHHFCDSLYSACDDIAALVRCQQQTAEMGAAVVASANAKHTLSSELIQAKSLRDAIGLLRSRLVEHKAALIG
jgi:hypothetical protein